MFGLLHKNEIKTILLHRFIVKWNVKIPKFDEDENQTNEIEMIEKQFVCASAEQRDAFIETLGETSYTVEEIDQTKNEWASDLKVRDWMDAERALEVGEQAWRISQPLTVEKLAEVVDMLLINTLMGGI